MKGAVERLIDACAQIQLEDGPAPIDDSIKEEIFANVEVLAEQGLRVLALAAKPWSGASSSSGNPDRAQIETDMTLYGLVGIYDPPRPETKGSVRMCHEAGIQVHMLTGDHAATARAIALQVGILPRNVNLISKDSAKAMVMTAAECVQLPLLRLATLLTLFSAGSTSSRTTRSTSFPSSRSSSPAALLTPRSA